MNKQILLENLEKIGLDGDEVIIYTHLLEKGAKTPLELSRELDINRTRIYRILESLLRKKIIQENNSTWGKKFKADQPENLRLLIDYVEEDIQKRKELVPDIISELKRLPQQNLSHFEVVHYRGVDGLKQMLWNELTYKEVLLFGYDTVNTFVGKTFGDKFRSEAVRRGMTFKEIINTEIEKTDAVQNYNSAKGWNDVWEYRAIPEKNLKIRQGTQVYGNTVSIINWADNEYAGLEIKNKNLADMQRQLFWHFWELAKKSR